MNLRHQCVVESQLVAEIRLMEEHQHEEGQVVNHAYVVERVHRLVLVAQHVGADVADALPHQKTPYTEGEMKNCDYHGSCPRTLTTPREEEEGAASEEAKDCVQ